MTARPRLLVARRGGLGDALLAVPLLRAVRRAHPGASVAFAGVGEHAELLVALGVADAGWSTEGLHAAARHGDRSRFLVDAAWLDDPALAAALPATARVVAYSPLPRARRPLALQLADACGVALRWPDDAGLVAAAGSDLAGVPARSASSAAAEPTVLLAPGSGGRAKCWPRARWLALAGQLAAAGCAIAVLVGPVEAERDDPRRWPWPGAVAFLADVSLPQLAARLAATAVFVGNDSGTTHLAAMLGAPTVALFGPTDPQVWAPNGPRVTVLGGNDPAFTIDEATVAAAVRAALAPPR